MLRTIVKKIRKYRSGKRKEEDRRKSALLMEKYFADGQIPWSPGYQHHKTQTIIDSISNIQLQSNMSDGTLPKGYGYRLDERVVEYLWLFTNLTSGKVRMLDAGSTFNFPYIVTHPEIENKDLTIFTFAPEDYAFNNRRISYVYGDLRDMSLKNDYFDLVVSQSTIEHIDMDNSMYGYELEHNTNEQQKSYDYLIAVKEMLRVLKAGGMLLLTFPFGAFEHHGFFQQFDAEMIQQMFDLFAENGKYEATFFKYEPAGWRFAIMDELSEVSSYNPHTDKGKGDDHAAHSRSIACIKFVKNQPQL